MMDSVIFVFGSNLAGRHGAGAARVAARIWGAQPGVGRGPTGRAYALPTKDAQLRTLPLADIAGHLRDFAAFARTHRNYLFYLTPIGTGLAGHAKGIIWNLLGEVSLPSNVVLAATWVPRGEPLE
jgi:hypothetical protein